MKVLRLQRYPLLKFLVPLALLVAAFGVYQFFTQDDASPCPCPPGQAGDQLDPAILFIYLAIAAVLAFGSLAWRKKEDVVLMFPSDTLATKNRSELQKILDGLEAGRASGEISEDRYQKARAKVGEAMKGKK